MVLFLQERLFYHGFLGQKAKVFLNRVFLLSQAVKGLVLLSYFILGMGVGINAPIGYYFIFVLRASPVATISLLHAGFAIRDRCFILPVI